MTLGETLKLLSPELLLLLTGLVVLIADMIWRDEAAKTLWMPGLALGGLGLALAATLWLWQTPPTTVMAMMAVDPFALFFKVIAIGTVVSIDPASSEFHSRFWPMPPRSRARPSGSV